MLAEASSEKPVISEAERELGRIIAINLRPVFDQLVDRLIKERPSLRVDTRVTSPKLNIDGPRGIMKFLSLQEMGLQTREGLSYEAMNFAASELAGEESRVPTVKEAHQGNVYAVMLGAHVGFMPFLSIGRLETRATLREIIDIDNHPDLEPFREGPEDTIGFWVSGSTNTLYPDPQRLMLVSLKPGYDVALKEIGEPHPSPIPHHLHGPLSLDSTHISPARRSSRKRIADFLGLSL